VLWRYSCHAVPNALRDAFKTFNYEQGQLQHDWAGCWNIRNTTLCVYPMGELYEPCKWDDYNCHAKMQDTTEIPSQLVLHHITSGVWLQNLRQHNRRLGMAYLLTAGHAAVYCAVAYKNIVPFKQSVKDH